MPWAAISAAMSGEGLTLKDRPLNLPERPRNTRQTGCAAAKRMPTVRHLLRARISSSSLLAMACTSPTVGGSLTVMTKVFTALLLLLVPLMALLSCMSDTSPGGPWGPEPPSLPVKPRGMPN